MPTRPRALALLRSRSRSRPRSASAQIEVAGDWDQPGGGIFGFLEESLDRGGGPDLGDYVGLPINDALRYKASLYSPSWLSVPEHQCLPHPSTYQYRSPGGLSIVKEYDPVTQRLVAYRFYGSYGLARTVWMDGRPHPPANARHTYEGFSTGRWEGNRLVDRDVASEGRIPAPQRHRAQRSRAHDASIFCGTTTG